MLARRLTLFAFRTAWLIIVYGAVFLCFLTFTLYLVGYETGKGFVFFRTEIGFLLAKREFVRDTAWMTAFYFHITGSMLCLLIGPFQFVSYFRKHFIGIHRKLGKVYILSVLAVGAPSGFYMALFANGGILAQIGFSVLSVLWIVSTYLAYQSIRQKNIQAHMAWMVRSYALTFSAVTLRAWVPILSLGFNVDHDYTVIITAWLNWIPNVIVGELLLKYFPKKF